MNASTASRNITRSIYAALEAAEAGNFSRALETIGAAEAMFDALPADVADLFAADLDTAAEAVSDLHAKVNAARGGFALGALDYGVADDAE